MESSNQRSWSRDQGKLWGTNINQSTSFLRYWGGVATFFFLVKSSYQELWKRTDYQAINDDFFHQSW